MRAIVPEGCVPPAHVPDGATARVPEAIMQAIMEADAPAAPMDAPECQIPAVTPAITDANPVRVPTLPRVPEIPVRQATAISRVLPTATEGDTP